MSDNTYITRKLTKKHSFSANEIYKLPYENSSPHNFQTTTRTTPSTPKAFRAKLKEFNQSCNELDQKERYRQEEHLKQKKQEQIATAKFLNSINKLNKNIHTLNPLHQQFLKQLQADSPTSTYNSSNYYQNSLNPIKKSNNGSTKNGVGYYSMTPKMKHKNNNHSIIPSHHGRNLRSHTHQINSVSSHNLHLSSKNNRQYIPHRPKTTGGKHHDRDYDSKSLGTIGIEPKHRRSSQPYISSSISNLHAHGTRTPLVWVSFWNHFLKFVRAKSFESKVCLLILVARSNTRN